MNQKIKLHVVAHTHWDREWYLSFEHFRRRFVKLMDHLLDLFAHDNRYTHFMLDGQTLVLKDYLEIRPEKKPEIRELISNGKLAIGPWYSQPNEFMVSGEAIIRNLMLGIQESKTFGNVMELCYAPDAFGHITQLPQIIRGFGYKDIIAWRGIPPKSRSVLTWKGADGSECLLFNQIDAYGNAMDLPMIEDDFTETVCSTPWERKGLKNRIHTILDTLAPRSPVPHLLLMNGVDHSFAQSDLPEIIAKIKKLFPDIEIIQDSLEGYVRSVRASCTKNRVALDTVVGEMRDNRESSILSSSLSMRYPVKKANSDVESLFEKWMEPFTTFSWLIGGQYPAAEMARAWEYVLENHAHDSLGCGSADIVFRQVMNRFEWAHDLGADITHESLQVLTNASTALHKAGYEKGLVVFNPLSWTVSGVVSATIDVPVACGIEHLLLHDDTKEINLVEHSVVETKVLVFNPRRGHPCDVPYRRFYVSFPVESVGAYGYKTLRISNGKNTKKKMGGLIKADDCMENEYLRITIAPDGSFDLFDKTSETTYCSLHVFEDGGEAGDGFSHNPPSTNPIILSSRVEAKISIREESDFKASMRVEIVMQLPIGLSADRTQRLAATVPCRISSTITLAAHSKRVDIETVVDNQAKDHRLRVCFPTHINTSHVHVEQPFDVVKREIGKPQHEHAHPQNSFVDVSDGAKGLMIANRGIYEYEVSEDLSHTAKLTLLRSTEVIYVPFNQCGDLAVPQAQCLGMHTFHYSIIPHKGTWEAAYRDAYEFKFPMQATIEQELEEEVLVNYPQKKADTKLPKNHSFVTVGPEGVVISAIKKHKTNNSVIVRVCNMQSTPTAASMKLEIPGRKIGHAFWTNLNEEREESLPVKNDGSICFDVHGKGLATFELTFEE